jgi:hypothetical protein
VSEHHKAVQLTEMEERLRRMEEQWLWMRRRRRRHGPRCPVGRAKAAAVLEHHRKAVETLDLERRITGLRRSVIVSLEHRRSR